MFLYKKQKKNCLYFSFLPRSGFDINNFGSGFKLIQPDPDLEHCRNEYIFCCATLHIRLRVWSWWQGELGGGAGGGGRSDGSLPRGGGQALRTHPHAYRKS